MPRERTGDTENAVQGCSAKYCGLGCDAGPGRKSWPHVSRKATSIRSHSRPLMAQRRRSGCDTQDRLSTHLRRRGESRTTAEVDAKAWRGASYADRQARQHDVRDRGGCGSSPLSCIACGLAALSSNGPPAPRSPKYNRQAVTCYQDAGRIVGAALCAHLIAGLPTICASASGGFLRSAPQLLRREAGAFRQ
jgi:hypothetical protein